MTTSPEDLQKCPACDAMVDPALLSDVVSHFFDAACITGTSRRPELDVVTGEKVEPDA